MTLKERIEQNIAIWLLGTLLTGFLSGIGAYRGILEIAALDVAPKGKLESLEKQNEVLNTQIAQRDELLRGLKTELEQKKREKEKTKIERVNPTPIAQAPLASAAPKAPQDPLRGKSISIYFENWAAATAIRYKEKLEERGLQFINFSEAKIGKGISSLRIYYRNDGDVVAAQALLRFLKDGKIDNRISYTEHAPWLSHSDLAIWLE